MAAQSSFEAKLKESISGKGKTFRSALLRMRDRCYLLLCWARLLSLDSRIGLKELVETIVGNEFFGALQVASELEELGEILLDLRPNAAAEIGTCYGGTLFFLTRIASPCAEIVSIDLPGGRFGGGYSRWRGWLYRRFARAKQRLYTLRGDSHSSEMLKRVRDVLGSKPLDYLFIDGDHSYEGVKRDFNLYTPLVRAGGIVALHDVVDGPVKNVGGVPRFWNEIKSSYRYSELIKDRQQGGYGIGVLYVDRQVRERFV